MSDEWRELNAEDAAVFLEAVREQEYSLLFEPSLCEVFALPLPFYDGYELIRISNRYSPPFILMDFISNGDNHYYLDGTDHALQTLSKIGATRLSEDNVLLYIDLYFSYVYERGNSIVFIRDPQNTNYKGSEGMGVHFKALQQHPTVNVAWSDADNAFIIRTPILYQEKTHDAVIHVDKAGIIDVKTPLKVTFLDAPKGFEPRTYKHPQAVDILQQARDLLLKSPRAKALLDYADEKKIHIHCLGSPNYQAFCTNKPLIYLFCPSAQYTADYMHALILAAALDDARQISEGYTRPSHEEEQDIYLAVNYHKNLRSLAEVCKIVDELKNDDVNEAYIAMQRLGMQNIYAGIQNGVSDLELLHIYQDDLQQQGYITD